MPEESPKSAPDAGVATVLCIEDQPLYMLLVEEMLSKFPRVRLLKASNGNEGIRIAQSERPELVLLDMNLPDMSGLDVVRALSELLQGRRVHLVLLTGESLTIDVIKALSLGASEYWQKPLTLGRLRTGLGRMLPDFVTLQ